MLLLGFISSLAQCAWDKKVLLLLSLNILFIFYLIHNKQLCIA
jgi:hypothetical protein